MNGRLFRPGELSKILGISTHTLRILEGADIVQPLRTVTGFRVYTEESIKQIKDYYREKRGNINRDLEDLCKE